MRPLGHRHLTYGDVRDFLVDLAVEEGNLRLALDDMWFGRMWDETAGYDSEHFASHGGGLPA